MQNHGSDAYIGRNKCGNSVSTHLRQNMTHTITKRTRVCERKARIVRGEQFISPNRLTNAVVRVLSKRVLCFSISFLWYALPSLYANFSSTCVRVPYASPQKLARPPQFIITSQSGCARSSPECAVVSVDMNSGLGTNLAPQVCDGL